MEKWGNLNDSLSIEHKEEIQVIFPESMDLLISSILNDNDINNNNNNNNNNNIYFKCCWMHLLLETMHTCLHQDSSNVAECTWF